MIRCISEAVITPTLANSHSRVPCCMSSTMFIVGSPPCSSAFPGFGGMDCEAVQPGLWCTRQIGRGFLRQSHPGRCRWLCLPELRPREGVSRAFFFFFFCCSGGGGPLLFLW